MNLSGVIANLTPFKAALLIALAMTGLMFFLSFVLLLIYRVRFHRARDKCLTLGPELKLTQDRLEETTGQLENTVRKLDETVCRRQSLLDEASAGIFLMNRTGDFTYINSRLAALCGLTPRQVLREGLIQTVHPEDRDRVRAEWNTLRDRFAPVCSTFRFLRSDGSAVTVLCQMYAMKGSDQNVAEYVGLVTDITELHKERAALQDTERRIYSFIEQTAGGWYRLSPAEPVAVNAAPDAVAERIYKHMSLAACSNAFAALYGRTPADLTGTRLNDLPGGCGPFTGLESIKAFVKAGFKCLETEVNRADPRGNYLCLQNHAAGIVEDGYLVGIWGTQRDFSRQKRAHEALDRRITFMEKIVNALPGDVLVKDTMCRFLYVNRGMVERTGIPAEEWIGKTVFELMPATPRDFNKNSIEAMKTGRMCRTVSSSKISDGAGWKETFEIPLTGSEGIVEGAVSLSLDVSDRVNAELALQKSEEQFRTLMEGCPEGMILADADSTKVMYANPAMCDFTGYTAPELLDMRIADIHPPGSRQQISGEFAGRARSGRGFEEPLPCLRKDRSVVFAEINASMVWIDGREMIVGVYSDATERKMTEAALRGKNEYHLNIIRHAPGLFAVVDAGGMIQSVNDALVKKLGYTEEELKGVPYIATLVAEADRGRLAGAFSPSGGTAEAEHEYRLLTKDGEEIFVGCRIRPLFDKNDQLVAFSTVALDITRRRRLEEQMQSCCTRLQEQLDRRTAELEEIQAGRQEDAERTLRQTAQEMDELSRKHAAELAHEIRKREEIEERLRHNRDELTRIKEQLNAAIEQRTQALKDEIIMRKKREERLLQNESDLNQYRKELEASLQLRTQELEKQAAERVAAEEDLRQMRKELKTLSGSQKEMLAAQTQELKAQIAETKKAEEHLRQQEKELQRKQRELEGQIAQRTQDLQSESAERRKTEEDLKRLQSELQEMRAQQETLIARETEALNAEIGEYRKNEEALRRNETVLRSRAAQLEAAVEERTRELEKIRHAKEKADCMLAQQQVELVRLSSDVEAQVTGRVREVQQQLDAVRQEEQLLQRSERHYRLLFESSVEAFLLLDTEDGQIRKANPAALRLFGAETAEQLLGQSLDTLSPGAQPGGDPSLRLVLKHIQCAYEKESDAFEWLYRRADGTPFWGLTSLAAIEEDGRRQVLAVIRNIDALKNNQTDLQQAAAAAEDVSRINSRFVDDMQEALSSSLNPVVEIAAIIMNASNLSEDQRAQLTDIHRNSVELLDMMNNRLELTRMAAGAVKLETDGFDLYDFITEMNAKFCDRAKRKSLFFAMSHAHNVPRQIISDRQKMRKVLGTLLEYAMERTDKGRLGVHATCETSDDATQKITFELAYTARSMHDALLTQIFGNPDPLRQSDITGMELSLAISRRYAQMLGGDVTAETRSGGVSVLRFTITARVEESGEPGEDSARPVSSAAAPTAGHRGSGHSSQHIQRARPAFAKEASSPWG